MIRTIAIAIICASFGRIASAECVLLPPLKSSSHVRVAVVLGGKPLRGAKVVFRSSHQCTCATDVLRGNPLDTSMIPPGFSELTDENGIATLPELAPGDYDVAATLNDAVGTSFVGLHVVRQDEVSTLRMDLTEQVRRVEAVPIRDYVQEFRGTIEDVSGAVVPGANIVVVRKGSQAKDVALRRTGDANGHFSGQLIEGSYIAFFFFPGFRPAIVPFEVTKEGSHELSVSLKVGSCP